MLSTEGRGPARANADGSRDGWIDAVIAGSPELAVRDYGGTGKPVLLLHGAGRTLEDFRPLVPRLRERCHLYAMDLRGHGRSGDGRWTWDGALEDLDRVVEYFGLNEPAVVGHSLGGMVAVLHGLRAPARSVVNIDGHGPGRPELFEDVDPAVAAQRVASLIAQARDASAAMSPFTAEQRDIIVAQTAHRYQLDPADAAAAVGRCLKVSGEGKFQPRPDAATTGAILDLVADLDTFGVYRESSSEVLICHATKIAVTAMPAVPWWAEHQSALRNGICRELDQIALSSPIQHVDFDADHDLHLTHPDALADCILAFLSDKAVADAPSGSDR